jgi:hypothetical protein
VSETLDGLLDELDEACWEVQGLIKKRRAGGLVGEARMDMLGDLFGAVSHVHVHAKGLPDLISKEMDEAEAEIEEAEKLSRSKAKPQRTNGLLKRKLAG